MARARATGESGMARLADVARTGARHSRGVFNHHPTAMTPPLTRRRALASLLAASVPALSPAQAATPLCWSDDEHPRTADQLAVTDARVAVTRRLAHRINALLKSNAAMQALPETRLRSRWQIGGLFNLPARPLWLQARDHRPSMWVGSCGVLEAADRLPPRASVVVQVNITSDLFKGEREIYDEQLTAWREPQATGHVNGHPLTFGRQLVLTSTGRPPWVPVPQASYLDFVEREFDRQQAAHGATPYWDQQRTIVRAFRARLSAAELAGQARLGWTGQHPDVPLERWPRLVMIDPAFPWDRRDPQRAQIIRIVVQGSEAWEAPMQRVLQTLDLSAFEALMQPAG